MSPKVRGDDENMILKLVQRLNFALSPSMLSEIMYQLSNFIFPDRKLMLHEDLLRQSRLMAHLVAITVDRPAFMAGLLQLEVGLNSRTSPIRFNNKAEEN